MDRIIKMNPGDTIVGLFKKLKKPGDAIHVKDEYRDIYQSVRNEAVRQNNIARLLKEIKSYECKYSVIRTVKDGYTTIRFNDLSKVRA